MDTPNPGISVKAFIVEHNKLLILKRSSSDPHKANIWEIPGGRLEPGEDPIKGLIRETYEETGLNILPEQPINTKHFTRDDNQEITMTIFLCKVLSGEINISEEHSEFDHIPIENAKEKLSKFFHEDIDRYLKLKGKK